MGPFWVQSPSSPDRVGELLHLNLSGLQLEVQRCAPAFFGIGPRRLQCQQCWSPVIKELVIQNTKIYCQSWLCRHQAASEVSGYDNNQLCVSWGVNYTQVNWESFLLSLNYRKDVVLSRCCEDENPLLPSATWQDEAG